MKPTGQTLRRSLLATAMLAAFASPLAHAATLVVDPAAIDEAAASDGKCSLREAVLALNAGDVAGTDCVNSVTDGFGVNDTITLPAGTYTLTVGGVDETHAAGSETEPWVVVNVRDATRGDLDIIKSVKIVGAGSATTIVRWATTEGQERDRIFHVFADTGTVDVSIQGVTLTGGQTLQTELGAGPPSTLGPEPTTYFMRRAGAGLAVGPAAAVVLVDPNLTGQEHSEGRGGSRRPTEHDESGATLTLALNDVVVDGNSAQGDGGGIYTAAAMKATKVVVSNNASATNGGGIYNEGNTSIVDSTIKGNESEGGGGLFGTGSNVVNISGTTFSGNRAVGGGAISGRARVTMKIVNSTLSGNFGKDVGAGLYTNGGAELRNVTIADNLAGADAPTAGSGINTFPSGASAGVTVRNVLLANNRKGWLDTMTAEEIAALPSANCGSTSPSIGIQSQGHNLSSDASCATIFTLAGDRNEVDPRIGPLADNGGPTHTHALLEGSPAIGGGEAQADITVDQRGISRDSPPDIGAYEDVAAVAPPSPPTPSIDDDGGCTMNPNARFDAGLLGLLAAAIGGLALRRRREGKRT